MKIGNLDGHQSKMFFLIDEVMSAVLSDFKYDMATSAPYTPQYKKAKAFLSQGHDELVTYFYNKVMSCTAGGYYSNARFAGGDFLKEKIDKRLKQYGY